MKLDISCVRSILLTVEKYEKFSEPVLFDNFELAYYDDFLSSYTPDTILYHVQYCIKSKLLSNMTCSTSLYQYKFECCMEPFGHDFLANVRTEENWTKTKKVLSKLGDASLKVISATAEGITSALADKYIKEISQLI